MLPKARPTWGCGGVWSHSHPVVRAYTTRRGSLAHGAASSIRTDAPSVCLLPCSHPQYFPTFDELPLMDEYVDPNYYADVGGGTMLPVKHWYEAPAPRPAAKGGARKPRH